jgi:hypothetical protein
MIKTKDKKIFVEFIGLRGSGKTTICNMLLETLRKDGIEVVSGREFKKYKTFIKYILSIIFQLKKTADFAFFCYKNRKILHHPDSYLPEFKEVYKTFKKLLISNFIFLKGNFKYFLADQYILYPVVLFNPEIKLNFLEILNVYPGDEVYLIFVNTSLEIADKRKRDRDRERGKKVDFEGPEDKKRKEYVMGLNKKRREKITELCSLFKKYEGGAKLKKVVCLDGEKPVQENVEFIKKEIKGGKAWLEGGAK